MLVPEEHDGGSVTHQPLVDLVVIAEELGRVLYPGPFLPTNVVADAVVRGGTDMQRKELVPGIANGDRTAALCLTGDGSCDLDAVDVRVNRAGGGWLLDGRSAYVHDAHVADLLLVTAIGDDGPTQFLVPAPHPGVSTRILGGLDLTRRLCDVQFDGVELGPDAALGSAGSAVALVQRQLQVAAVLQCAEATGAADEVLAMTVQYAKDRVQFDKPIGSFQAVKHKLADMLIRLEAMKAATYYAALAVADDLPDRDEAVAVAKSYVGDAFSELAGEALQIHGGIGFTWEHDVHLFVRRAKADQVLYGDGPWYRESLCALLERTNR
jgi:alkylation response protein AidB-like acyl-CoA dehydrogenase